MRLPRRFADVDDRHEDLRFAVCEFVQEAGHVVRALPLVRKGLRVEVLVFARENVRPVGPAKGFPFVASEKVRAGTFFAVEFAEQIGGIAPDPVRMPPQKRLPDPPVVVVRARMHPHFVRPAAGRPQDFARHHLGMQRFKSVAVHDGIPVRVAVGFAAARRLRRQGVKTDGAHVAVDVFQIVDDGVRVFVDPLPILDRIGGLDGRERPFPRIGASRA